MVAVADLGGYPRYPWIPPFDRTGQRIAQKLIHCNFTVYNLPTLIFSSSTTKTIETLRANLVTEGLK